MTNQQAAREWLVTLRDEAQSLLDYANKHLDHMADTQQTAAYDWWVGRRDTLVELLEKLDQPRWLPIESAPKDQLVLVYWPYQDGIFVAELSPYGWHIAGGYGVCDAHSMMPDGKPTNWRPLPTTPDSGEK